VVEDRRAALFCAWLARSRFRAVVPSRDKTAPSVVMGLTGARERLAVDHDHQHSPVIGCPTPALGRSASSVAHDVG
jgi:hypothetical protein